MSEVYYFQRYSKKENAHSSNAVLLLKRLYFYSPKMFYGFINNLLSSDNNELLPSFITQERNYNNSIPDFCIKQNSFKIVVEAKEKDAHFDSKQIKEHLEGLSKESANFKIFITLSPRQQNKEIFNKFNDDKYKNIYKINITYKQLYENIKKLCNVYCDIDMLGILEEFKAYCEEEQLIDDKDNTIMLRLAGETLDYNLDNNIYFDKENNNYESYSYIGLCKDKQFKCVGKIEKIIKARIEKGQYIINDIENNKQSKLNEQEIENEYKYLKDVMKFQEKKYHNTNITHIYFLMEKFVEVNNCKIILYGKKKIYLSDLGLESNVPIEKIADKLKNKVL